MVGTRNPDASQRQELVWLLDEADSAIQAWWQSEQEQWPEILSKLISRLRLCEFDLEADRIDEEVQASPKLGRKGCRNRCELLQLRQQVVDRVRKRIIAIREAVADKPPKQDYISQQIQRIEAAAATIAKANRRRGTDDEAKAKKKKVEKPNKREKKFLNLLEDYHNWQQSQFESTGKKRFNEAGWLEAQDKWPKRSNSFFEEMDRDRDSDSGFGGSILLTQLLENARKVRLKYYGDGETKKPILFNPPFRRNK